MRTLGPKLSEAIRAACLEAHTRGRIYSTNGEKSLPADEYADTVEDCERLLRQRGYHLLRLETR